MLLSEAANKSSHYHTLYLFAFPYCSISNDHRASFPTFCYRHGSAAKRRRWPLPSSRTWRSRKKSSMKSRYFRRYRATETSATFMGHFILMPL
ncbi:hypothetical protein XENTR_v10007084 [Xenopus tropicalis]|nr:hypothetical protein XENTR_v10007084 [Xenopus tropicalis]